MAIAGGKTYRVILVEHSAFEVVASSIAQDDSSVLLRNDRNEVIGIFPRENLRAIFESDCDAKAKAKANQ